MKRRHTVTFYVLRYAPRKRFKATGEWLSGESSEKTALEEAQSLADDPLDTILNICLWSKRKEQFIGSVRSCLAKGEWPNYRR